MAASNLRFQQYVVLTGIGLFLAKIAAWYLTGSVAILTDALESIVNIISGLIGLYSLYLAARPRDDNHPNGHGKIEFVSAAIEGTLIAVAGLIIIVEALMHLVAPGPVGRLDQGIILVGITALVNYGIGWAAIRQGVRTQSMVLISGGKHLQTDTYSTLGIVAGLLLMLLTGLFWLDSVVALLFAGIILRTGYRIIRSSLAGIMDEADTALLTEVVARLQVARRPNWIDLHNLRIIKYGSVLHLDCHVTVPWYLNVREAHAEVEALGQVVREHFGASVELFVHTDACLPLSCSVCTHAACPVREAPLVHPLTWTVANVAKDIKHSASIYMPTGGQPSS
jgi:cation diffusion facilitator family transporter